MINQFLVFVFVLFGSIISKAAVSDLSQLQGTYADENGFVVNVAFAGSARGVSFETLEPMIKEGFVIEVQLSGIVVEGKQTLRLNMSHLFVSGADSLSFLDNYDNTASLVCFSKGCLSHRLLVEFRLDSNKQPTVHLSFQQWNNATNLMVETLLSRVE